MSSEDGGKHSRLAIVSLAREHRSSYSSSERERVQMGTVLFYLVAALAVRYSLILPYISLSDPTVFRWSWCTLT